jgi:hypothetical protein
LLCDSSQAVARPEIPLPMTAMVSDILLTVETKGFIIRDEPVHEGYREGMLRCLVRG